MTRSTNFPDYAMFWENELRLALEDPALAVFETDGSPGPGAHAAAYRLALCLGWCRALRIELPADLDGILPAAEAMAAAEKLIRNIQIWLAEVNELPSRWEEAPPGTEESLCADILQARLDAWAAFLAISEAYDDCVDQDEPAEEQFTQVMDRLLDALDEFDRALQNPEILALLSSLTGTPVLNNWRKMLGVPNDEFSPWFLDGTLERESQRIEKELQGFVQDLYQRMSQRRASSITASRDEVVPSSAVSRRQSISAIFQIQPVAAMAAAPADELPPILSIYRWRSPDERWVARLTCPHQLPAGVPLPLEFLTADGQPATELAGQPVWLAGQQQMINRQGIAKFDLESLKAAISEPESPIVLEVGKERQEWSAIPSE